MLLSFAGVAGKPSSAMVKDSREIGAAGAHGKGFSMAQLRRAQH